MSLPKVMNCRRWQPAVQVMFSEPILAMALYSKVVDVIWILHEPERQKILQKNKFKYQDKLLMN